MVRAQSLTDLARSNRSPIRSAAPISSASCACNCSRARPEMRCSSVRISRMRVYAVDRPAPGEFGRSPGTWSVSWPIARAPSSCTSRSPPRPCLRSGSARCAMSPLRRQRACVCVTRSPKRERMSARHRRRTPPISSPDRSSSPAICRVLPADRARLSCHRPRRRRLPRHGPHAVVELICASHSGYQIASATSSATCASGRLSRSRIRIRFQRSAASRRPSPSTSRRSRTPTPGGSHPRRPCR